MSEGSDSSGLPPSSTPGLLARMKAAALQMVENHEDRNGTGIDDYWPKPMAHAMADGKYLSALAELRRANILGDAVFQRTAKRAVARLAAAAVPGFDGGIAWGLNFPWGDRPADEAYLITTALVVRGLSASLSFAELGQKDLLANALPSLRAWPRTELNGLQVPVYSPSIARPIYNAIAQWMIAMQETGQAIEAANAARFMAILRDRRISGYGWAYEPGNNRVDLLHCCYLLEFCRIYGQVEEAEFWLLQTATQFCSAGETDAYDFLDIDAAMQRTSSQNLIVADGFAVLNLSKPLRPWSLGELLCRLSGVTANGVPLARALARRCATEILDLHFPDGGHSTGKTPISPRHAMHLLHGIASLLQAERARKPA